MFHNPRELSMFEFLLTIRQKKERLPTYAPLLPVVSIPVRGDRREAIWPSLTDPRFGSGGPLERERRLLPRGDSPSILVVVVVLLRKSVWPSPRPRAEYQFPICPGISTGHSRAWHKCQMQSAAFERVQSFS